MSGADLVAEAAALLPGLVALRRDLHREPETGLHLPKTRRRVLAELAPLGLEQRLGTDDSSLVAVLHGGRPGPAVLLRADMDALPIRERTGLGYASDNGAMHACGHDLHTAALTGAARLLHARRDELRGSVVFMFQPGEETGDGAARMIRDGLLDVTGEPPAAAYAVHVVPGDRGVFSTRPGPLMAGALELRVTVRGRGGHASAPHLSADPVPPLADLVGTLHTFATRRFGVADPVVLTVTSLSAGGTAFNVIEDEATLGASIRVLSAVSLERVRAEIPPLADAVAAAYGCTARTSVELVCPPMSNDETLGTGVLDELRGLFGADRVRTTPDPVMGSEDFAYVLERVPGAYFFLRATPPGTPQDPPPNNHTPTALFDDSVLADQAAALAALALRHLT